MSHSPLLSTGLNSGRAAYGRIVGAEGVRFLLDDGTTLIDGSNTAAPLGHCHPEMLAAVRAAVDAPVINEGWHWSDRESAAHELIETALEGEADWVGAVRFFLSGSEANDMALSLAQALTGRTVLATRERAYHGMAGLARDMTVQPHWHGGLSSRGGGVRPAPRAFPVVELPAPEGARIGGAPIRGPEVISGAAAQLADAAAVIVDYTQGGVYYDAAYQDSLATAAREANAVWIADEVVTGFGRTGGWFAFQTGQSRPDMVTLGKPLAAGAAPAGAIVLSQAIAEELDGATWQTYSTFRGHPLMVAALRAHLRVVARDGLVWRALELDRLVDRRMREIAAAHPSVSRIDGRGLHWTVELHGPDWREWRADTAEDPLATLVAARGVEAGALIGTSGEQTSLFLAPPLVISEKDLELLLEALDHGLGAADELYDT